MGMTVADLADLVGGEVVGDGGLEIEAVSSSANASPDNVVFAENEPLLAEALDSFAGAVVAKPGAEAEEKSLILVDNPRLAFVVIAALLIVHQRTGLRGQRAARVVLLAYLLLTLAYPGVKFVTDVMMG